MKELIEEITNEFYSIVEDLKANYRPYDRRNFMESFALDAIDDLKALLKETETEEEKSAISSAIIGIRSTYYAEIF